MHPEEPNIKILPLFAYDDALHLEIFLIELMPGCEHLSSPHKPGVVEHVLVASGNLEVLISGNYRRVGGAVCMSISVDQGTSRI